MKSGATGWNFSRVGGVDQVVLRDGTDIGNLSALDPKLWAVLAIPTDQPKLGDCLRAMDADGDGKVRVPDILRSVEMLKSELQSLDLLFEQGDSVPVNQLLNQDLASMVARFFSEGRTPAVPGRVGLGEVESAIAEFASLPFNGDGIIDPDGVEDVDAAELARKIISAGFCASDASGKLGLAAASLASFQAAASARLAWLRSEPAASTLPLPPERRQDAWELYARLRPRIDDFFTRCAVLAMAGSEFAAADLGRAFSAVVVGGEQSAGGEGLAALPIAMPQMEARLSWDGPTNPCDAVALAAFGRLVAENLALGPSVDRTGWEAVKALFEPYGAWLGAEPKPVLAGFGIDELTEESGGARIVRLEKLIERDSAMAATAGSLQTLRQILLLRRDFLAVLHNFVNLDDFYSKNDGCFRAGKLFLDSRELELCLEVKNPGNHGSMAGLSAMYLIYCDLTNHAGQRKSIVAALTAGDAINIFPGRNGVFYDIDGRDWDAVITKVVVQPISIREAFFSPYRWFAKNLEEFTMKRAASAEAASLDKMKAAAAAATNADKQAIKPEAFSKKMDVGTVAAIGVALGSIGAMVTSILGMFFGMGAWMPLGILAIFLLISGPSMILAYIKLRKRNIGPLLNAEGWAVNGKLKINVPFGATLSHLAALPPGATRQIVDPFAEKRRPWVVYLVVVLVLGVVVAAYFLGWMAPLFGK